MVHEDPYLEGTRWVARYVETLAPVGTGSLLVQVHNGPLFHKLLQAHSRSPTFPGVGASAAPCLAGVRQTQKAPTAAARRRRSTSRSPTGRQTGLEDTKQRRTVAWKTIAQMCKRETGGKGAKLNVTKKKKVSREGGLQLFLSPVARGESRSEHGSPRCEAPDWGDPADLVSVSVLRSTEMSAPVTTAASGRAGMRCVTASGGRGARLRSIHIRTVQREARLLPGRGGGTRNPERIHRLHCI